MSLHADKTLFYLCVHYGDNDAEKQSQIGFLIWQRNTILWRFPFTLLRVPHLSGTTQDDECVTQLYNRWLKALLI